MKKKILILDDSETVHLQIKDLLGNEFEVLSATDWNGAYKHMFHAKPELLLIDVNLVGMQGDVVARTVQTQLKHKPKMLLISSINEGELQQKAKASGCHGYIHKTWDRFRVVSEIKRHL